MEPAKSILDLIGYEKAAEVTGKSISRIYRWTYPSGPRQGTGGIIPHEDALKLLEHARKERLPLSEANFLQKPAIAPEPEKQGAA